MANVEEIKKKSFRFLHRLYELSGGYEYNRYNMLLLGEELGYDEKLTGDIVKFLRGRGLVESEGLGGKIGITSVGIKELEDALSHPHKDSLYFPSIKNMFKSDSIP
jgi:hypothetical protein